MNSWLSLVLPGIYPNDFESPNTVVLLTIFGFEGSGMISIFLDELVIFVVCVMLRFCNSLRIV